MADQSSGSASESFDQARPVDWAIVIRASFLVGSMVPQPVQSSGYGGGGPAAFRGGWSRGAAARRVAAAARRVVAAAARRVTDCRGARSCGAPPSSSTAARAAAGIAPSRRRRGRSVEQSTTVDACALRAGPPSSTSPGRPLTRPGSRSRCCRRAVRSDWPRWFGNGPTAAARARRSRVVRDPNSDGRRCRRWRIGGRPTAVALRQHEGEATGQPAAARTRAAGVMTPIDRPVQVGQEQPDRLVGWTMLGREEPLDSARRLEGDRDPVHGVGRQPHEPAAAEGVRFRPSLGAIGRIRAVIASALPRLLNAGSGRPCRDAAGRRTSSSIIWAAPSASSDGAM